MKLTIENIKPIKNNFRNNSYMELCAKIVVRIGEKMWYKVWNNFVNSVENQIIVDIRNQVRIILFHYW